MPRRSSMLAGAATVMAMVATTPAHAQQRFIPDAAPSLVPVALLEASLHDVQTDSAALGAQRGTEAARYEGTGPWVMRGFLGGLTLGPIGAGLVYVVANNSEVALSPQHRSLLLQEGGAQYANAYQRAYAEALHARRKRSALTGGAIGTAALAATAAVIWAVYYYY
jgi:hypothetical protein